MENTINWFEIFVADLPRAQRFYESLLGAPLKTETFNGEPHAIFQAPGLNGALVKREGRGPSAGGALVYLNCNARLDAVLGRVAQAGGKVLMPKTDIGAPGHIALIADSEGNAVGLHQRPQA
ncbi:MAG: VOC family protein [Myxococcaceae bacterium]|nr:VOC family protein [Myxococcaceae bacterium]